MKLRNCIIITDEDSVVIGGWNKDHGNVIMTNAEVEDLLKERLHQMIDREFDGTDADGVEPDLDGQPDYEADAAFLEDHFGSL